MPISAYVPHGLDDSQFLLSSTSLQSYKSLFSSINNPGQGLSILQSASYAPENFKSLGLVAFFSKGQIVNLLAPTYTDNNLRPDTVGLIATLGLDGNTLCLITAPSDEVGRIIPSEDSFDQNVVKKWIGGTGTIINDMEDYQTLRDDFMNQIASSLRYEGFEKLESLAPGAVEFNVDGASIFNAIFANNTATPQNAKFHVIIRDDDNHTDLENTPAKYLTIAVSLNNNPTSAYSGRATPAYTVYNGHPR